MKHLYFLLLIFTFPFIAIATHNNAGEITYRHIDTVPPITPTYEIKTVMYVNPASPAIRDTLELKFTTCDYNTILNTFKVGITSRVMVTSYLERIEYVIPLYTFPGPGCYRVSMRDMNRIAGITNIAVSDNVAFYIEDSLIIKDPQILGFNSSPVLNNPPIAFAKVGVPFYYNPAAYEPDGDSLTFDLIPPKMGALNNVTGYYFPGAGTSNTFSIDRSNGEIAWIVPHQNGIFNVAILIREFRNGQFIGSMIRDMQIRVSDFPNAPPILGNIRDTCIIAGSPLNITVTGTDSDIGQILSLTAFGGPFMVTNSPAIFSTVPSNSPVSGVFDWQTNCSHIRPGSYSVVFNLFDDYQNTANQPEPYMDIETWNIKVVAPPPSNLKAEADLDAIRLTWDDPYQCTTASNFRGFSIWRKTGCDSLELQTCQAGELAGLGYSKISGAGFITDHFYNDNSVARGIMYSYRVQAEFAEVPVPGSIYYFNPVSGMPSNEACMILKKDVPIITNVDVIHTDPTNGTIDIIWVKPLAEEVDTIENPGPYKYELYRFSGQSTQGSSITVATFTSPSFGGLSDTLFQDSNLNTLEQSYSYKIGFFAGDGSSGYSKVGNSDSASSVFLTLTPGSENITLSWTANVAWDNYKARIFREMPTGSNNFILIDSVAGTNSFTEKGLINGELYCYKIQTEGTFYNPDIKDPVINHSQIACAVPIDSVAPCPPLLSVTNGCDMNNSIDPANLQNYLSWLNTDTACSYDIASYNIYYSPNSSTEMELVATVNGAGVLNFNHEVTSLAGCYVVTAVDSFSNESRFSNNVCVDNCPVYKLPNAFTPNGDGFNDYFKPFIPYLFVDRIDMKIFNRWGNLVFETTDPDILWNGKIFNSGKDAAEGVYYYVCDVYYIKLDGIQKGDQLKGYIHLISGNGNTN